jgi:hypothetical protein
VDGNGSGSSSGSMAAESGSGGVVGRLVDGDDGFSDTEAGDQQKKGERRRLDSSSSSLKSSASHTYWQLFSCIGWWGIWQ